MNRSSDCSGRQRRLALVLILSGLGFCACTATRPVPLGDGSYRLECSTGLASCANRASATCGDQGYYLVEGSQQPMVYGSPNGEQIAVDRSEMVFRCGNPKRERSLPSARPLPPPARAHAPAAPPPRAPRPERLCTPGATQSCVGPGRCSGGQACLPDGGGFGLCDCGAASAHVEATPTRPDGGDASPPSARPEPQPEIESPY